jgi:hypothetical protein
MVTEMALAGSSVRTISGSTGYGCMTGYKALGTAADKGLTLTIHGEHAPPCLQKEGPP